MEISKVIESQEKQILALSEKLHDAVKELSRRNTQRQINDTDLYGITYYSQSDGGAPANFYLSISQDLGTLSRFQFKLIVKPFISTVKSDGIQDTVVSVNNTSLSARTTTGTTSVTITPNPHGHTTQPHNHNVIAGFNILHPTPSGQIMTITLNGVDITPYLAKQIGGMSEWSRIREGVYPDTGLDDGSMFDLLEVASDLTLEGRTSDVNKLLDPGFKPMLITWGEPPNALSFAIELISYSKYSNVNR